MPPVRQFFIPHEFRNLRFQPSRLQGLDILLYLANQQARMELGISPMFGRTKEGRVYLTPNFINTIGYRTQLNLQQMVNRTLETGTKNAVDSVRILGEALRLEQQDDQHLLRAHRVLAVEMRKALIARYGQSVEKRRQVPTYPRRNRLAGHLRRAISQPDMVVATATGINYINQDRLNIEARHWARINFGVKPAQSKAPEQFRLFGGGGARGIGTVGLRARPRPPMFLPPGFWQFIDGRTNYDKRNVRKPLEADDRSERAESRSTARRSRVAERLAARGVGGAAPSTTTTGRSRVDTGRIGGFYRTRPVAPTRNSTYWGAHVGPLGAPRTYTREYTVGSKGFGGIFQKRARKTVTSPNKGIRRSQQGFYPTGRPARYPTAGVVASNFMDAGFRALRDKIDRVYLTMATNIINEAEDNAATRSVKKLLVKYSPQMEINRLYNR